MAKGETVKYIIDADTSGFSRAMVAAAVESDIAGKKIQSNLSSTSKKAENNFKDIRKNAATAASSIRNFGVAFQAFNTTSAIIGVTALSGAFLELSGALAAAGSTISVLAPIMAQAAAGSLAFKAGVSGLSDAFKAIGKNDPKAFAASMINLGPAAKQVALAVGGLNKAFNSIKLNTQQALLAGLGDALLTLGAHTLPIVNAGFQQIGFAMNDALKIAAGLASSPAFSGLLASIFADTARNVTILSGALEPILTIFTNLYAITAPYVSLLASFIVDLTKTGAAYLSSSNGQAAFNLSIMEGVVALKELGNLVGSVLGLVTSVFRSAVVDGNSLIVTLTGIINAAQQWVNSAKGQVQLAALFHFSSLAVQTVASALGLALSVLFDLIGAVDTLNPGMQQLIVGFLASALTIRPLISYLSSLYQAFKVLFVTIFNVGQQIVKMVGVLGALTSIALVAAIGLIVLGNIIGGPLGSALEIVGGIIASFIVLNYLLGIAAVATAPAVAAVGEAGIVAAGGLTVAASAATALQASLLPLLILAAGILVILGMLGVFSSKSNAAAGASAGLSGSLASLQKSLKSVGTTGNKTANSGLASLSDSLNNVSDASANASDGLASFDKMNVLTSNSAATAGIPGLPSLPDIGGGGVAAPTIDTGDFDKAISDLTSGFDGVQDQFSKGFSNPFDVIGKWINAHPWVALAGFVAILGAIAAAFVVLDIAAFPITVPIALIALALVALTGIVIILQEKFQLFTKIGQIVMTAVQPIVDLFVKYLWPILQQIGNFISGVFMEAWKQLTKAFDDLMKAIQPIMPILKIIGTVILVALIAPLVILASAILIVVGVIGVLLVALGYVVQFLIGLVDWLVNAFTEMNKFFIGIATAIIVSVTNFYNFVVATLGQIVDAIAGAFTTAWNAIVAVWSAVIGFFQGIFNAIGTAIGFAIQIYIAYFTTAWNVIKGVWGVVVQFFQGVWNGITGVFSVVANFFGSVFGGAWEAIKNAFGAVSGFFQGIWNSIVGIFGSVGTAIGDAIGGAFKSVVNTVLNAVSGIVNTVIDLINGAISLIDNIPGVNIGRIPRLTLPRLAKGGVVSSSTFAEIGENGAEAVMPLENNTQWIDKLAEKINASNGSNGGQPINLTVQIGEDKVASKIIDLINEKTQMGGRNTILV